MSRKGKIKDLKELVDDNEAVLNRIRAGVAKLENGADTEIITRASAFSGTLLKNSTKTLQTAGDILFDTNTDKKKASS